MSKIEQTQKQRIRIRNLVIRVIMVLAFALVVLFAIENLIIPVITNSSISVEYGDRVVTGVGLSFSAVEEYDMPLDLQVIQSLRQEYADSAVKLVLRGAILSGEQLPPTAEQICLTKLWAAEVLPISEPSVATNKVTEFIDILNAIPVERKLSMALDDFCAARGKTKTWSTEEDDPIIGLFPFSTGLSPYYYPFDVRTLDLEIWVETEIEYEDGTRETRMIAPNMHTQYNLPDWQLSLYQEQTEPENRAHPVTKSQVTLQRAFASRLLTATLLSSLFIIIILLGFTNQIDAFIQASVAVLLTLLGIQDLLIPAAITETNIVNQIILGLYILFALAVLSRLTVRPIWEHTRLSREVDAVENPEDEN
jgi:hypothetical protein